MSWELLSSKGAAPGVAGDMLAANNLSELTDKSAARGNLSLGSAATHSATDFDASGAAAAALAAALAADIPLPASPSLGEIFYWNGTAWIGLPIGARGTFLNANDGQIPSWVALSLEPRTDIATTAALAAYTYDNTAGTITINTNGALANQDGVTAAQGQIYLVRAAHVTSGIHVGLYTLTTLGDGSHQAVLTRHNRLWTGASASGVFVLIRQGTQAGYIYQCQTTPGSDVVGTNAISFTEIHRPLPQTIGSGTGAVTHQGGVIVARATSATDVTMTTSQYYMGITSTSAARTVTLPGAAPAGTCFVIQDESNAASTTNSITVAASSGSVSGTNKITTNGGRLVAISDGTNYWGG